MLFAIDTRCDHILIQRTKELIESDDEFLARVVECFSIESSEEWEGYIHILNGQEEKFKLQIIPQSYGFIPQSYGFMPKP